MQPSTLSDEQMRALIDHLQAKWGERKCPYCGVNNWTVMAAMMLRLERPNATGLSLGGPTLPSAAVVCTNCGHTVLVNLVVAGVVK